MIKLRYKFCKNNLIELPKPHTSPENSQCLLLTGLSLSLPVSDLTLSDKSNSIHKILSYKIYDALVRSFQTLLDLQDIKTTTLQWIDVNPH